jgi:hypothetical protein
MTKFSKKDRLEIIQTAIHELLVEDPIPKTRAVDVLIQNIKLSF